ncbi:NB-ARC domain-containing protein [Nocardia sp. NPDC049707]|uniref:ATP-binding protein n=1 Tax=Nocardia sp. NPDC049707 TaxID=3154735 RepID=UPI0034496775
MCSVFICHNPQAAAADCPVAVHRRGDLSAAVSGFVGRHTELQQVETLLSAGEARLITLVGPGGIGKTTLAAEALLRFRIVSNRRVCWARLARLAPDADTDSVAEEVMRSVARGDVTGQPAWEGMVDALVGNDAMDTRQTVLVLDKCEHVLSGVAHLVAVLLSSVPGLTITATSREPIGWIDEHIVTVPPLPVDQAVDLFRQRAELIGRSIPDDHEQPTIAEQICRHVDNNPLFIRLAAARLRHQPPAIVLRELTGDVDDIRMHWSHGARAGVEDRHRSVHDAIAWSYLLCTEREQLLLDRISVFATASDTDGADIPSGGAEADAIRAVCADQSLPAGDIDRLLERLVERSLVSTHISSTTVRYFLLESVRVFARDRLRRRDDDLDETRLLARHRRYYRDKVVAGQEIWLGPEERIWFSWVNSAWENILIGIETSFDEPTEIVVGLETVAVLMAWLVPFFGVANRAATSLAERALRAIRHIDPASTRLRVDATALMAWNAIWQGEIADAAQLLDECVAHCVSDLELRRTWRDTPTADIGLPAAVEFSWGIELMCELHPAAADVLSRARRKFADAGDRAGEQRSELFEGLACAVTGDPERAVRTARRHLDRAIAAQACWSLDWAEVVWLYAICVHGEINEAMRAGQTALKQFFTKGDTFSALWFIPFNLIALGHTVTRQLASGDGDPAQLWQAATEIAHMCGMSAVLHRAHGIAPTKLNWFGQEFELAAAVATKVLGEDAFAAAMQRGEALRPEFDELRKFLLDAGAIYQSPSTVRRGGADPSRWHELSRAEREVAVLAAAGWANSAIAARRGSSIRTVDAQVAAVLRKLLIANRLDIIGHVPAELEDRIAVEAGQRPRRSRNRSTPNP